MDPRRQKFLASVLGDEGAELLIKTIDMAPVLEHAIVPRTILAWLQSASGFEGEVLDGIQMAFEKSEAGFTGSIAMGGESHEFEDVNIFHVAASVAATLGMTDLESEGIRTLDLERLGKTIDLMSKAHRVNVELEKADVAETRALANQNRQTSGQYGHGLDSSCATCSKRKGQHLAERPWPMEDGSCEGFKAGKGKPGLAKDEDELEKKSPPGKFNDLPEKLKAQGMPASEAFGIAWKQHDKEVKKDEDLALSEEDEKLSDEEFERKYDVEKMKARKAKRAAMAKAIGDSAPPPAPTAAKPQKAGAPKSGSSGSSTGAPKMTASKGTSTATMSLTRSEAGSPCLACGGHQFADDMFVGCLCFEAIAKAVRVKLATPAGLVLELDRRLLDQDDVDALTDAFKATGVTDGK